MTMTAKQQQALLYAVIWNAGGNPKKTLGNEGGNLNSDAIFAGSDVLAVFWTVDMITKRLTTGSGYEPSSICLSSSEQNWNDLK